jgi:hypothetical protein
VPSSIEVLRLNNGRELYINKADYMGGPGSAVIESQWKGKKTNFDQTTRITVVDGKTTTNTVRISGNHLLRRVTRPGMDLAAPWVYTNGGIGADIGATIQAMSTLAKAIEHDVQVDLNAVQVVAHPGESVKEITDRAEALGVWRWSRP